MQYEIIKKKGLEWTLYNQTFMVIILYKKCLCGENVKFDNEHLYNCLVLNEGQKPTISYIQLFNGTLSEQRDIVNILNRNMNHFETFTQAQD